MKNFILRILFVSLLPPWDPLTSLYLPPSMCLVLSDVDRCHIFFLGQLNEFNMYKILNKLLVSAIKITLVYNKFGIYVFWADLGQFWCAESKNRIGFVQSGQLFYIAPYELFTYLGFPLIYIHVDKVSVRITVNSSWLIYLLNLGTCVEHLRQWTKEARSSLKLLVEITAGQNGFRLKSL